MKRIIGKDEYDGLVKERDGLKARVKELETLDKWQGVITSDRELPINSLDVRKLVIDKGVLKTRVENLSLSCEDLTNKVNELKRESTKHLGEAKAFRFRCKDLEEEVEAMRFSRAQRTLEDKVSKMISPATFRGMGWLERVKWSRRTFSPSRSEELHSRAREGKIKEITPSLARTIIGIIGNKGVFSYFAHAGFDISDSNFYIYAEKRKQ